MADFKNTSLRKKLIIMQLTTAFLAVLICCIFFLLNDIKIYKASSVANKKSMAEIIAVNAVPALEFSDPAAANQILQGLRSNGTILNAVILDKDGKEFARYDKQGEQGYSFSLEESHAEKSSSNFEKTFLVSYKIDNGSTLGTVMLRGELSRFGKIILSYVKIAAFILLFSLAIAFLISTLLQRSITYRLLSLMDSARKVTQTGNYSVRVVEDGKDEIGVLSAAFNKMLEKIDRMKSDLHEANIGLERRVNQRTAELEAVNKELESFSYSVSHDLRAPLRGVAGYAQMLREDYGAQLDAEAHRIMNNIMDNAKRMGQLIDDLLTFSRLGRKELVMNKIPMDEIVNSICAELSANQNAPIDFEIGKLAPAEGDNMAIKQVWINLISNAIKYSKLKPKQTIKIGAQEKGHETIYYVKDNGAGFDMRYADKLFGVFQRLHSDKEFEGTGVGLAIVQRIITKHGGRVWAEAKVGEGATFYFSLNKLSNQ